MGRFFYLFGAKPKPFRGCKSPNRQGLQPFFGWGIGVFMEKTLEHLEEINYKIQEY